MSRALGLGLLVLGAAAAVWLLLGDAEPESTSFGILATEDGAGNALRGSGPGLGGDGAGRGGTGPHGTRGTASGKPGVVDGFVLEHGSRKPIPGATVLLMFSEGVGLEDSGEVQVATTAANGSFRIPGVTPGTWVLFALHEGFVMYDLVAHGGKDFHVLSRMAEGFAIHAPAQTGGEPRVLTMTPAKSFAGRVLDDQEQPVAGATIHVEVSNTRLSEMLGENVAFPTERPVAVTGPDGRFRLPTIAEHAGSIKVTPQKSGYAGHEYDLDSSNPPDEATGIALQMERTCRIAGRLTYDDGEPAEGVSVWISSSLTRADDAVEAMTDADGRFDAHEVPADVSELDFYIVEPFLELEDRAIEPLKPGEERVGLEFQIPAGITIRGRLVDEQGAPIADASIDVRVDAEDTSDHGDWESSVDTDDDGYFLFGAEPDDVYMLFWDRHDKDQLLGRGVKPSPDVRTFVSSRVPRTVLELRVLDARGEPVPRFRVDGEGKARDWEGDPVDSDHRSAEGRDGVARVELSGSAPWTLLVHGARFEDGLPLDAAMSQHVLEALPDGPYEIQLLPGGSVQISLDDEEGAPLAGTKVSVEPGQGRVRATGPGRFVLENVPRLVTTVTLEVAVPEGFIRFAPIKFELEGEELRLVVRRAAELRGRVAPGRPLSPRALERIVLSATWNGDRTYESDRVTFSPGPDGSFVLRGLPPGADVWVESLELPENLYLDDSVHGKAGQDDFVVPLAAGESMKVIVRGLPTEDAPSDDHVWVSLRTGTARVRGASSYSETLGPNGVAEFRGIHPGTYDVVIGAGHFGGGFATRRGVPAGSTVEFTAPPLASIEGRVERVEPNQLIYVHVIAPAEAESPLEVRRTWPVANHENETAPVKFHVSGCGGRLGYTVLATVYDATEHETVGVAVLTGVIPGSAPVVLHHHPPRSLTGTVRRASGDERVLYVRATGHGFSKQTTVDEDGSFSLGQLPEGRYDLKLLDTDGRVHAALGGIRAGRDKPVLVAEGAAPADDD